MQREKPPQGAAHALRLERSPALCNQRKPSRHTEDPAQPKKKEKKNPKRLLLCLLQSCGTHGCKHLRLLGSGDPRWVGSPQVEAAKAGGVQTPSWEILRPWFYYWSRLKGESGRYVCPLPWSLGRTAVSPWRPTKLEAWAPGGTFKIPLSGWKTGFFFFFFWSAPSVLSPGGMASSELLPCLLQSCGTHEWKPLCPSEWYAIRSEGGSLKSCGADLCTNSCQRDPVPHRGLRREGRGAVLWPPWPWGVTARP